MPYFSLTSTVVGDGEIVAVGATSGLAVEVAVGVRVGARIAVDFLVGVAVGVLLGVSVVVAAAIANFVGAGVADSVGVGAGAISARVSCESKFRASAMPVMPNAPMSPREASVKRRDGVLISQTPFALALWRFAIPNHRVRHLGDTDHLLHVVHAHDVRAALDTERDRDGRALDALIDRQIKREAD